MYKPFRLLAHLDRGFDAPAAGDASRAFLTFTIAVMLVGAVFALLVLGMVAPDQITRVIAPSLMMLVALVGRHLLVRNKIQTASQVLAWGVWASVTIQAIFSGGVHAPVVVIYPVTILMAGWVIRPRAALTMAGLCVAATWGLAWAETQGLLPPASTSLTTLYAWNQSIVYILCALLVLVLVHSHRNRLRELHQIGNDLSVRTHDLETSKADLDRAQQVANVGSWVYDIAADRMRLSAEACRIFGMPQGRTSNRETYLAHTHPDDRDAVKRCWQAVFQGEPFDHEHRILVDGTVRWIRQKAQPGPGADGATPSVVGIAQDITQRKEAQVALQESEERYRTMIEWSPDPILVHRGEKILYVNAAAIKMFGARDAQDLVGKWTFELIHPDSLDAQRARMANIINQVPIPPMVESRFLRLDGTAIDVEVQGTAIVYDGAPAIHVSIRDISDRRKALAKIHDLAFFDQLTGLPNRTLLMDRLRQTMAASARSGHYCALLFADLDNFKTLNDTLGHDIGDVLLKQVAQRISSCVRAQDTVGRLGGDEFLVLLTNLSMNEHDALTQTEATGEKIRAALNQPFQLNNFTYHCTPSIGATLFEGPAATIDDVLKQADMAMYKAKAAGRNALRFFDTEMETVVLARAALEADLRQAVQHRQFVLHYQPQVVGQGHTVGVEALVRWQHPRRGTAMPAEFIALAEETGLILPVGYQVLEMACAQLVRWAARPEMAHLTVSVNVSTRQFHQHDFVGQLQALLARTGANPQRLTLELKESLLITHVEEVIAKMATLKSMGVRFSLDDFGTGFSSLSCLSRLPLDQVKIDRSFVTNIESNDNAVAICAATIGLAHSLQLEVVAEGVETEAQRYFLQAVHRCNLLQGYLFSRALPIEEFERWMQQT